MSNNFHIFVSDRLKSPNGVDNVIFRESFNCLQTPSKITKSILESDNPIQAYINWITENFNEYEKEDHFYDFLVDTGNILNFESSTEESEKLKADFEKWAESHPYETFGMAHVQELNEFIEKYEKLGFEIKFNGH